MVEQYLSKTYLFRYNVVKQRTYLKEKKNKNADFEILNDFKVNSIKRELDKQFRGITKSDLHSLLHSDFVPQYHPFADYFSNLPVWDGETDFIGELAATVTTNNQELFTWAFKKWLVAMVACAIHDDITNQTVLILTGKQGIGKSTWLKRLLPAELSEYFYSGIINPNQKDSTILMSEKLLINLDELASLTTKSMENFKEMITKPIITERRPYAYFAEDLVRRASFIGSSNHTEILSDVTGNRRFLCFEVSHLDYTHSIDLNLVYSQALHLLTHDFRYFFNQEDVEKMEENNKRFIQSSQEEDWIEELFKIPGDNEEILPMSASEVVNDISKSKKISNKLDIVQIGKILTSKGFTRKKVKGAYKYLLARK